MKTTLIKLATMSLMALAATSTAAIPAQAASHHPVQSSPSSIPLVGEMTHTVTDIEDEVAGRSICRVGGIVGWFGGMVGGNDVCGDN